MIPPPTSPPLRPTFTPIVSRTQDVGSARGGSETVLIAEDHDGLRELAIESLANLGYTVLAAADGESALNAFQSHRDEIDLLLLDVVLPKLGGPEVYSRIHAERPDIPVIFATGYSADMALLQKAEQKELPIIQKPYSPKDLARKVRESLDQRVQLLQQK
jgi:two-component system, cell cycle sensor histidine kinase and response regulator CckA